MHRDFFPDHLKISIVKLLLKEGDKTIMTNYKPISLLTVFSKVLVKVRYSRLSMHINSILIPEQCGFRQGSSIENAAFKLTESVLKFINKKNVCWWDIL
jgi:hypothetical protein